MQALGHSFVNYVSDGNATCTEDGTQTAKCEFCEETDTKLLQATGHKFVGGSCKNCGYTPTKGLKYELNSDGETAWVTGIGSATDKNIYLAYTYMGKPVTAIAERAFSGCGSIKSVSIPESVTYIGNRAFYQCYDLKTINISDNVSYIGRFAFDNTAYYNTTSYWKNGVLYLGNHLIAVDVNLSGAYEIRQGTKTIGGGAFFHCINLTGITIPDSVMSIGEAAFSGCNGLTGVTIPDSITSISDYAFEECHKLTSITIPDSVKSIGSGAFERCSGLTSITIPDSVTSIGNIAFERCSGLERITIPDSVKSIGSQAFEGCSGLESIIIPGGVASIGSSAFESCSRLKSAVISYGVTSIGSYAFSGCSGLMSITIPDSVTSVGVDAFEGTEYYKDADNWENGVLYIGKHLIATKNFSGETYEIRQGTLTLAHSAFRYCSELSSITIPDSVTSIGTFAFTECRGLTDINFAGTTAQWNAIEKTDGWDRNSGDYTVHCTDGDISK